MARVNIPQYGASKQIEPGSAPRVQLSDAVGAALKGVGSAIGNFGEAAAKRQEDKENFQATNDYNALQQQLAEDMRAQEEAHDGDGEGFYDSFVNEAYKPRRDQFMSNLPKRLQEKYSVLLSDDAEQPGSDYMKYSTAAAKTESGLRRNWYSEQIGISNEQLASAISMDPDGYDMYRQQGADLIEQSGLLPSEKHKALREWDRFASTAFLNKKMEDSPEEVLRQLNIDPRQASPTTKMALLEQAVIGVESNGDPDAVSSAGAVGLMQVMPGTGAEIAKELDDKAFPHNTPGGEEAKIQYLKDPAVNRRYGSHYLKKQLRTFGYDVEAALIAYNGGPERAKAWLAAGRDDAVIPKETRDYYKKVLGSLSSQQSLDAQGRPVAGTATTPPPEVANQYLKKVLVKGKGVDHVDNMEPQFQSRLASLLQAAPPEIRRDLGVFSGARSVEHQEKLWNEAVKKYGSTGEARKWVAPPGKSRHNHGKAADLSYKGNSLARAPENVVKWLHDNAPAHGLDFPLGNENWHIELAGDRGGSHDGKGHHDPTMETGTRFSSLTYADRQAFANKAEQQIAARTKGSVSPVQKVELRRSMANEIELYQTTGAGSQGFDENAIVSVLGEDDYSKWQYKRDIAETSFKAVSGIKTMSYDDMQDRLADYAPQLGSEDFASQQQVREAVLKEVDRVTKLRAKDPAGAAMEFDDVKAAKKALDEQMAAGNPEPAQVRALVDLMLERQKMFDIPPSARAPIPRDWALGIGRMLSEVPTVSPDVKLADVRNMVAVRYEELEKVFGDQTDEVIVYALSEYNGVEKSTADLIGAYMSAIALGKDPFKVRGAATAAEADKEQLGVFGRIGEYLFGDDEPVDETEGASPEALLRKRDALRSDEDDDS